MGRSRIDRIYELWLAGRNAYVGIAPMVVTCVGSRFCTQVQGSRYLQMVRDCVYPLVVK